MNRNYTEGKVVSWSTLFKGSWKPSEWLIHYIKHNVLIKWILMHLSSDTDSVKPSQITVYFNNSIILTA